MINNDKCQIEQYVYVNDEEYLLKKFEDLNLYYCEDDMGNIFVGDTPKCVRQEIMAYQHNNFFIDENSRVSSC